MPVINIDGLQVNYSDTGSGSRVVFVPGLVGCGDWFSYQSTGLSDHHRVISYDLRSHPNLTLDQLVGDLERLLDALHVHAAAVVGYSLGGLIALRFALAHPERCTLLVLDSTTPGPPSVTDDELAAYYVPAEFRREPFLARLRRRLFGSKPVREDESDPLSPLKRTCHRLDPAVLAGRIRLIRRTDLTAMLGEVDVPALVMAGSLESSHILSAAQLMDEAIPDSALEIIEGADQYHFYTSHDRYNSILDDHLAHRAASL